MKQILIIILGIFFLWNSDKYKSALNISDNLILKKENLIFSDPAILSNISFGYKKVLAHYFWFRTLNYFGKHFKSDKQYHDLEKLCNISTILNKHNIEGFEFCSLMFAWELKQPEKAIQILNSAIQANPSYWKFYYLRGSIKAFFLNNIKDAKDDFLIGTDCPDAPNFLRELVDKIKSGYTPNALKFLEESIQSAKTNQEREILLERYNELKQVQSDKVNTLKGDKSGE